jgi:hypothetical protein
MDLFRKTMKPVEQVMKDAGVKKDEIDDVSGTSHKSHSETDFLPRLFSLVVLPESPRSSSSSRSTSTARSHLRVSTQTRLSPTEPPFKEVSSPERREAPVFFSSMSAPSLSVSRPPVVS